MDLQSGDRDNTLPSWLKRRRIELRISKAEAARRAGVGRMAWYEWEAGRRLPYDTNYAGIEDAMRWERSSVLAIQDGREPTPLAEPAEPDLRDDNERTIWSMDAVDEELRRDYIRMYREKQARAAEKHETG